MLDRWWICTMVEELCVALREEFRYSLVGRSVGRSAGGCVCVSSLGSSMRSWGVDSRPLQN